MNTQSLIGRIWQWLMFVIPFIMLFSFVACDELCRNTANDPAFCKQVYKDLLRKTLTAEDPVYSYDTGPACACDGFTVYILYNWQDKTHPGKDRPPVTVQAGISQGKGGQVTVSSPEYHPPKADEWSGWTQKVRIEGIKNSVAKCSYYVRVILQRPFIKAPKGPGLSFPFIGSIIGPDPTPVVVDLGEISYEAATQ